MSSQLPKELLKISFIQHFWSLSGPLRPQVLLAVTSTLEGQELGDGHTVVVSRQLHDLQKLCRVGRQTQTHIFSPSPAERSALGHHFCIPNWSSPAAASAAMK